MSQGRRMILLIRKQSQKLYYLVIELQALRGKMFII